MLPFYKPHLYYSSHVAIFYERFSAPSYIAQRKGCNCGQTHASPNEFRLGGGLGVQPFIYLLPLDERFECEVLNGTIIFN